MRVWVEGSARCLACLGFYFLTLLVMAICHSCLSGLCVTVVYHGYVPQFFHDSVRARASSEKEDIQHNKQLLVSFFSIFQLKIFELFNWLCVLYQTNYLSTWFKKGSHSAFCTAVVTNVISQHIHIEVPLYTVAYVMPVRLLILFTIIVCFLLTWYNSQIYRFIEALILSL